MARMVLTRRMLPTLLFVLFATACGDGDAGPSAGERGPDAQSPAMVDGKDASHEPNAMDAGVQPDGEASEPRSDAGMRAQDTRTFSFDAASAAFTALPDAAVETDRISGVLDGAGYRIEIPKSNWNGKLVLYAHGYSGTGEALRITNPSIRRHLIDKGYAWAASSYSKNYYDVRVGVEDTNKLALNFVRLVGEYGRAVAEPTKRYIIGHSMGGHVAGAAIEKEAAETAMNKVAYHGAVPMCGVMGDSELFNYFAGYQLAAQYLADMPATAWPVTNYAAMPLQTALFSMFPTMVTPVGSKLRDVVMNLTGGKRPGFEQGFASMQWQGAVWMTFGGDGTIAGILAKNGVDTRDIVYQLDSDSALNAEEKALNEKIFKVTPEPDANPLRSDGVRAIPKVHGEFAIKVVTLHTLGDLYVPFKMQQIYRQRALAKGTAENLVQRAVRAVGHCEFALQEQIDAFEAMVHWVEHGVKPEGDEVLDPAVVGDPNYGCKFTAKPNQYTADETNLMTSRAAIAACPSTP